MILTFVRFDSCDWEAWYLDGCLLIEGNVVSAFDLAWPLAESMAYDRVTDIQRIDDALVDPQTGKAPLRLTDVKRAAR